jgi:hypothetical protein
MDKRNPVGCGLVAKEGDALPNFEQPSQAFEKAGPAGFGAIASYWSPRLEVSGTYDDAWRQTRYPLLPRDWNNRSLLCSPLDQLPERPLEGGELVELTNLTPDGQLRFVLPKLKFSFRTFFSLGINQRPADHSGRLASVIIEPDFPRVILVWSTTLPCRKDGDYLEETLVRETRPV